MPWLERLDARAARWPAIPRRSYTALRWALIALGAYLVVMLAIAEHGEHRVGLGLGVVTMLILAAIKGVIMAWPPAADDAAPRR